MDKDINLKGATSCHQVTCLDQKVGQQCVCVSTLMYRRICCASILSLVQFLFSFVFVYMVMYDNEYKTKEDKN